ncbi:hypothetical protein [Neobacillus sp. FSL H8-0543]
MKLLFLDKKITTNIVYEWCQVVESEKMIRRILKKNFKAIGPGKYCYYE